MLFEEDEYFELVALARAQKVTVGHLIRRAIKKTYVGKAKTSRWAIILSEARKISKGVKISAKEWKEFINEGRKW